MQVLSACKIQKHFRPFAFFTSPSLRWLLCIFTTPGILIMNRSLYLLMLVSRTLASHSFNDREYIPPRNLVTRQTQNSTAGTLPTIQLPYGTWQAQSYDADADVKLHPIYSLPFLIKIVALHLQEHSIRCASRRRAAVCQASITCVQQYTPGWLLRSYMYRCWAAGASPSWLCSNRNTSICVGIHSCWLRIQSGE